MNLWGGSSIFGRLGRSRTVASYHLYYLRDHRVVGSDSIDAADDNEAVGIAREQGKGQVVEVWNAHSRIRVVAPARAAPAPS